MGLPRHNRHMALPEPHSKLAAPATWEKDLATVERGQAIMMTGYSARGLSLPLTGGATGKRSCSTSGVVTARTQQLLRFRLVTLRPRYQAR